MPRNDRLLVAVVLGSAIAVLAGTGIFVYAQNMASMSSMSHCNQMTSGMGMMGNMMGGSSMTPAQCQAMMSQCQSMMNSHDMAQCEAMMQQSSMTCK